MDGQHFPFDSAYLEGSLNNAVWPNLGRTYGPPPAFEANTSFPHRKFRYALNWSLYEGTAYQNALDWVAYKDAHSLPWRTRQIRNLIAKLCDFYGAHIYQGQLTQPGQPVQIGIEQNIMLDAPAGNEALFDAVATLWEWWGWPDGLRTAVAQDAALGDILLELVDDIERRKVMVEVVWPGYIKDIELDAAGNLKQYTKEYGVVDDDTGETYTYARTVTTRVIQTFKNGEPWDYVRNVKDGPNAEVPNPYGYVPARWIRWNVTGSDYGEPAIYTAQSIYDDLCALAAASTDRLQVYAESPLLVSGTMAPGSIKGAIDEFYEFEEARPVEAQPVTVARMKVLQVPPNTRYEEPAINMEQVENRIKAIEDGLYSQFPETRFEEMLREMTQLTGPGAERAMLDVRTRYASRCSTWDRHIVALCGMAIAMAGLRYNDGSWAASAAAQETSLTDKQNVFANYGLDSYNENKLAFTFLNRTLIPATIEERVDLATAKIDLGIPALEVFTRDLGYSEETLREWEDKNLVPRGFFTGNAATPVSPNDISLGALIRDQPDVIPQPVEGAIGSTTSPVLAQS